MPLRYHKSVQTMMDSNQESGPKSFLETNCTHCGDDVENLRQSQKVTCRVCKKVFHYPTCWKKHKDQTGHTNV